MRESSTSKNKNLAVSVILPVLNAAEDIQTLFTHLAHQVSIDKSTIEIIIINDGSTDATVKEIEAHKHLLDAYHTLSVIEHPKRLGLTKTRLDGAKAARGEFITFIDKKCRPDDDYLFSFISKNKNIVIGNPYVNKNRSLWGRILALVRKKIYYPYFNHPFEDITLDYEAYRKFKNKGGGGSMFVLRKYYLQVAKTMPTGKHVNDDSLFIERLSKIEPILKTSSAKLEYINRSGFIENILHLYNRGPKFIDFYAKPGRRFFPHIVLLVALLLGNLVLVLFAPYILIYELISLLIILIAISLYLAEDIVDFFVSLMLLPIALIAFSLGTIKGILLKLFRMY